MKVGKEINEAAKITLVFVVITGIFALLEKLSVLVPVGKNNIRIGYYMRLNAAWLVAVLLVICLLCIYIKKADGQFSLVFLKSPMLRKTSGLLIIFTGIINITNKVSTLLLNIRTFHQTASALGNYADDLIRGTLLLNIIQISINLLLILTGLYFVLHHNTRLTSED